MNTFFIKKLPFARRRAHETAQWERERRRLPLARGRPALFAGRFHIIHRILVKKWYFDELYDLVFVRPAFYLGRGFWKTGDGSLIDGVGPDGVSAAVLNLARRAGALQTGYLYHYAFAMLTGVVVLVKWYLFQH